MFVRYRVVVDVELRVRTTFGQEIRKERFVDIIVKVCDGDFYCRWLSDVVLIDFEPIKRNV